MSINSPKTRNISNKNLKEIYDFIDKFEVHSERDERDLAILKYAYIDNLSGRSIHKLNDPRMISFSKNNGSGKLTEKSIRYILRSYNLEYEKKVDFSKRNNYDRRNSLRVKMNKVDKPRICGCCSSKENLELHHIIPIHLGGNDEYYNLIYLCHDCHMKMHLMIEENFKTNENNIKGGIF